MMMMNCFCGMVDQRKALSLISNQDHCQRSSPSWISNTLQAGFEPAHEPAWMKLCSSDNHYTTTPLERNEINTNVLWKYSAPSLKLNQCQQEVIFGHSSHTMLKKKISWKWLIAMVVGWWIVLDLPPVLFIKLELPSQHFKVGSTLFQRCGSTLK